MPRRPPQKWERREAFIAKREQCGYVQQTLAERIGVDFTTIASWERGHRTPAPPVRPKLAEALGIAADHLDRLLGISPPIQLNGHVVPRDMSHYDSLMLTAGRIEMFERASIPGLAQTERYAAGVEVASGLDASEIMARVDERIARQAIIYRDDAPAELTLLLAEIVLYEVISGPDVMAEQVDHLAKLGELPNVTIQLLPADGRSLEAANDVELLTKPGEIEPYMAVAFDPDARLRYFAYEDLDRFASLFARLTAKALPPDQTAIRLSQIRSTYYR